MKIVHLLKGKANPATMNGVNKVVHQLACAQLDSGLDVEVWGITSTPNLVRHSHPYRLRLFPEFRYRILVPNEMKDALQALDPSATLFHLHSVFLPELYAASRQLRRLGIEWVHTPHAGYIPGALLRNAAAKRLYIALIERRLLRGAARVHALTARERDAIRCIIPSASIAVIPNGQEPLVRAPRSNRLGRGPVFGFCGRLDQRCKGLDLLLDGFAKYVIDGGSGQLRIIGDGEDLKPLQDRWRHVEEVYSRISFKGALFGDDKLAALSSLDAFFQVSRWEGMPMSVLEAAGLGLPLVISEETNLGQYVEDHECGIVLQPNSTENIAAAMASIEILYNNGGLIGIGKKALQMVDARFRWPDISAQVCRYLYGFDELPKDGGLDEFG